MLVVLGLTGNHWVLLRALVVFSTWVVFFLPFFSFLTFSFFPFSEVFFNFMVKICSGMDFFSFLVSSHGYVGEILDRCGTCSPFVADMPKDHV